MTAEPLAHHKSKSLVTRFRPQLQHIFGTAFVCGPILAAIAPLGIAPLFTIVAIGALVLYLRDYRAWPWPKRGTAIITVAFVAWLALSALWTVAAPETLRFLPRAILYIVGGLALVVVAQRLPTQERRVTDRCLVVGVVVGAALFAVEILSDGAIASALHRMVKGEARVFETVSLNRGAAVFAMIAFPAAVAARRRFGWLAALSILTVVLALTLSVPGFKAAVGAGLGMVVFAAAFALGKRIVPFLAAVVVIVIVTAPLQPVILGAIPGPWATSSSPSVKHRVIIWQFVSEHILERPMLGWGLNSSRAMPGGKEGPEEGTELLPLHPHNLPLQLWLELGAIGALIAAAGLAVGILALRRLFYAQGDIGLAAATVASAGIVSAVGYGAWQGWWISTFWIVAAAVAAVAPEADRSTPAYAT